MAGTDGISTVLPPVVVLPGLSVVAVVSSLTVKLSPIVGYIVMGAVAAAVSPGFLEHNATLTFLADLGVVLLLFDIGLHFSPSHLREQARDIFVSGPSRCCLVPLVWLRSAFCPGFLWPQRCWQAALWRCLQPPSSSI
jgi:CPA2 family monovalent cation:H+ antiporter-2